MILSFRTGMSGPTGLGKHLDPDQTAGAVWSGSTLFAIPSASFYALLYSKATLLCPRSQLRRSWRCILLSGCSPVRSSQFFMHAISYELCMLGFWNFVYGFFMEKSLTPYFFSLCSFLKLCPIEKIGMKSCQQDISKSIWARAWNLVSW